MRRLLLIANPASSQFTGGSHRTVVRILRRAYQVDSAWPQSPDHARELTAQAAADSYDVVAAMGGDGVAHHVAEPLIGTETALGVIPTGTTNVYARLMGIPGKPVPAARLLSGPNRRALAPVLAVDGHNQHIPLRSHALFAAGFGFDADVVRRAESEPYRKYRFGGLHYARTAITTLLSDYRTRASQAKVTIDGEVTEVVAMLIQFHPAYTYFGPLRVSIGETPKERMSVLTVDSLPARRLPRLATTLLRGGDLNRVKGFHVWKRAQEVRLESAPAITGQADGELTGPWSEARAVLRTHSLRVLVPSS